MKILHTADWHIGRSLYGRKRYDEFESFLAWLAECIDQEHVDTLLVAGDIFDNSTPSNKAQELYYRFLCRVSISCCRHVVVTAGNHDSPSFLNAPKELLRHLNVHVIGCAADSPADEVLILANKNGDTELLVCAVPYLRDRDIRTVEAGESLEDKGQKMLDGIRDHYQKVCEVAMQYRSELSNPVPIVAMGHLFTTGGKIVDGDGVRELYVGSLAHVGTELFPECIDYLALGHLHVPQMVGKSYTKRYSGSPIPMGFGEARQEKSVLSIEFSDNVPVITHIPVPRFQELELVRGDWETIARRLNELKSTANNIWLEIVYEGDEIVGNLRERLDEATFGTRIEVLRAKNNRMLERAMSGIDSEETLDDLDVKDVFVRCLDAHNVSDIQRGELLSAYGEILVSVYEHNLEKV